MNPSISTLVLLPPLSTEFSHLFCLKKKINKLKSFTLLKSFNSVPIAFRMKTNFKPLPKRASLDLALAPSTTISFKIMFHVSYNTSSMPASFLFLELGNTLLTFEIFHLPWKSSSAIPITEPFSSFSSKLKGNLPIDALSKCVHPLYFLHN